MENSAKARVRAELVAINKKIAKLLEFIYGADNEDKNISPEMKTLMRRQFEVMTEYAQILHDRLAIWDDVDVRLVHKQTISPTYLPCRLL